MRPFLKNFVLSLQRSVNINYDLENSPLQIKTDSIVGSDEKASVRLFTAGGQNAGRISLHFTSPPQYHLRDCTPSYTNFRTSLPTQIDKIWTIKLTRTSGIRLIINCNNKEVLNMVMSYTTCSSSSWSTFWNREVDKIKFHSSDSASDYYRPGKQ